MEWFATSDVDYSGTCILDQLAPQAVSATPISSVDARSPYAPLERFVVRDTAMDRPVSTSPAFKDSLERPVVIDPIERLVIRLFGVVAWFKCPCQESVGYVREPTAHGDQGFATEAQDTIAFGADQGFDSKFGDAFGRHAAKRATLGVDSGIDQRVEKFRTGGTRRDHQNLDTQRGEFDSDRLGPTPECEFRSTVLAFVWNGAMGQDRSDVQYGWPRAELEQRNTDSSQFRRCEEVDLHDFPQPICIGLFERADRACPGVVDENIQTVPVDLAPLSESHSMGLGGQVSFDSCEFSRMILCLEDQPVQSIFSTRSD